MGAGVVQYQTQNMAAGLMSQADIAEAWLAIQHRLKAQYGDATFKSWFSKLSLSSVGEGRVVYRVPTRFVREWVLTHYRAVLLGHWQSMDARVLAMDIIVQSEVPGSVLPINYPSAVRPMEPSLEPEVLSSQFNHATTPIATDYAVSNMGEGTPSSTALDPRFTFDNFIVGGSNALAHAAAYSVADSVKVQPECNPLFLYGGVGLGKTHLMHATAWQIAKTSPKRKVLYLSAEKFMYQFVRALRNKDIMTFKDQFRSVDVLMIDDVQFICGKDSTQEEFFHTFNALIENNCQLVISCDRSPSDLEGMEDRIKSRLGWGLVADVHSTNYELRLGILQSKIEQMQLEVPEKVLEFLAYKITSNVRELEGALNKVIAHSSLVGTQITLESTQIVLQDLLRSNERTLTVEIIQKKVAEHYNIRVTDMSSDRRLRAVARPRQVAMYLSKMLTLRSLADIGKRFGGKDHTTVMHAVKKIEELIGTDRDFYEDVKLLERKLQA
jgi:chromosomal replication initiator protein